MTDITIDTVLDALSAAVETAEVWLMDHTDVPVEDRLRLYGALHEAVNREGRLSRVTAELRTELTVDMVEGARIARTADGRIWKAKRTPTRRGFDKVALRSAVNRHALGPIPEFDEATGEVLGVREPTPAEAVDVVWQAADVATGRTKVLRETFGVDLDEYAETSWKDELTEVSEADLKPEELAKLRPCPGCGGDGVNHREVGVMDDGTEVELVCAACDGSGVHDPDFFTEAEDDKFIPGAYG